MQELRQEVGELRRENAGLRQEVTELRTQVGYWKSMHARAAQRNVKLQAELDQANAEIRQLKAERFGKQSEKQSRIPLDNNYGERLIRNPAVGRKNYQGSGAEWSGRRSTMLFSIFATLLLWKINPRTWLSGYFDACAAAGGKSPENAASFLPWNLSPARLAEMQDTAPNPSASDTS